MISKDNFSAEHIRELQLHNHRDPLLLERTLFAFGLLGAVRREIRYSTRFLEPSPNNLRICGIMSI